MRRTLMALSALALTGAAAQAAPVDDLYYTQAIVTGTVEPERTRGFRAGLVDVIVKLTGDVRLADGARLTSLLAEPHRFVARLDYEDRMKGITVHDEQGTRERPHFLKMHFEPSAIDAAIKELGLVKWPPPRPVLAVWLGVRRMKDSFVLQASGPDGYGQRLVIRETSARRGIPVFLPAENGAAASVTVDDIAASDMARLRAASPDASPLLAGVLSIVPGGYWDMRWRLAWHGHTHAWTLKRVSFDTALTDGLEKSALILSGNDRQ